MAYYKTMANARERRQFDPANREDQAELGYFIKNKKWRNGCPFFLEFPYSDVPVMCMTLYTEYSLAK